MKLSEHVNEIRNRIEAAFDKYLAIHGVGPQKSTEPADENKKPKWQRFDLMLLNHKGETGSYQSAREKLLDELTFTLFNRLAAIKVMEAANMFPPILTRMAEHGGRSFGHKAWLEYNPDMRTEDLEGIREYIKYAFDELGATLPLYHKSYPYAFLPDTHSLSEIIDAFNAIEKDSQAGEDVWNSDDILGWLYESYNSAKKQSFKDSKEKTEFDKVSLQSQVYTPRWVVKFLVENSLGKLYLEMFPDSKIKSRYKIANVGARAKDSAKNVEGKKSLTSNSSILVSPKKMHEIKLIDPACGSGNFLLYAFDFFYELYLDQIENYGVDEYDEKEIPRWIIEHNLHGVDLDDRAIQLAQLGLYIKARKKNRKISNLTFKVVSSDFYLPDYTEVRHIFEAGANLDQTQKEVISEIWEDLKFAYKFGSLIQLDAKFKARLHELIAKRKKAPGNLFSDEEMGAKPKPVQGELFVEKNIEEERKFASEFLIKLKTAVEQYAKGEGSSFLTSKTRDAITFLELLTSEYDVATANPPYTANDDFDKEIRNFIQVNYKSSFDFSKNLYAAFIKKCHELVTASGFIAMIHPLTFMYIKDFEGVRKFLLNKTFINELIEFGLGGVFLTSKVDVDVMAYILSKNVKNAEKKKTFFMNLQKYKGSKRKREIFENAFGDALLGLHNSHNYFLEQNKLRIIKSWPFIYWISDDFRDKFEKCPLSDTYKVSLGLKTGNNEKFLRFHWEVHEKGQFLRYTKGGNFNNWYGNEWLVIPATSLNKISLDAKQRQEKLGVSSSRTTSKGASFRIKGQETIVDDNTINVFVDTIEEAYYLLSVLNSKVTRYIFDCLNPTVHVQAGDLQRVPLPRNNPSITKKLSTLAGRCVKIKLELCAFSLVEPNFAKKPIDYYGHNDFTLNVNRFMNIENFLLTQIVLNEAAINKNIFEIYDLTELDKDMVLAKEGESIGGLPVCEKARQAYLAETDATKEFPLDDIKEFIEALPVKEFTLEEREAVESGFPALYRGNNDLEKFCKSLQVNPINVWYWFKQSKVIPEHRMNTLALEFLADMIREILMEDEDGIVPLVPNASETTMLERIEEKFITRGFTLAQYSSFNSVLGKPIDEFLNKYFFAALANLLNVFRHLPMTPFIWHLSSGPEQGFDCYIIIYKWSRDKLMRLRSVYIEHRERSLKNRQSDIADKNTAEAQNEKDRIFKQLKEIEAFKKKIDELLAEGYNPILDDGVGKNIAPLQKKKMIPYEVLNPGQLKKYLNADW